MTSEAQPIDQCIKEYDVFVIGGGINGCGIARDASGRGLSVALAEMGDLASGTSSASTKLFHGGLRYLEYFEVRLVREALAEREVLLRAMPHISWPMRFVLPYHEDMRFEGDTPTSRLLNSVMPWMKGRRPAWLIRFGLFLYDHLGGRKYLPATRVLDLRQDPAGAPLQDRFERAFEYSDCWVEDSRLVLLNARDAADRGADIMVRTKVSHVERFEDHWLIHYTRDGSRKTGTARARLLVNAGGPWVGEVLRTATNEASSRAVRLVRGSHIVTRSLFDHDRAYFFQGEDGRIIFAIPYETDFTLIGTTDQDHTNPSVQPVCTEAEQDYLCEFASKYFKRKILREDVVWTYSGVRALYDENATSATAATRDYVLKVDQTGGAPMLTVFGGKITTYRKLAESALDKIAPFFQKLPGKWTAGAALPGGDFPVDQVPVLVNTIKKDFPFLTDSWAKRLIRAYGTEAAEILGDAKAASDLGEDFGETIYARELDWAVAKEWVKTADDFLWRRSKLGLRTSREQNLRISAYIQQKAGALALDDFPSKQPATVSV